MNVNADGQRHGWAQIAAFFVPILFLASFAAKPYQADDHLTIWVAEQIAKHPLDFFGFDVDYGYTRVPIHTISHNPPGTAYLLALLGSISGWNIVVLHLGMSLFAGLAALGIYELARDRRVPAFTACAAAVLTPAFLVSASTLMTDAPMLAFYVWAVVAWRRGCERASWRWLFCAAVCASLAPMMKFFGVTLVPLLLLDGALRRPRIQFWWVWMLAPVAAFAALQAYTYWRYHTTPFLDAASVATSNRWRRDELFATRPLLTLVFTGGAFLPLAVPAGFAIGARWSAAAFAATAAALAPVIGGYSLFQLAVGGTEPYSPAVLLHLAAFAFAGLILLLAAARALTNVPIPDAVLLGAWIAGTILFTAFVNHYVNVRTILPALPAVAVLTLLRPTERATKQQATDRRGDPPWSPWLAGATCAVGAVLSAWLLVVDYDVAEHDARAARTALRRAASDNAPLYYVAFWGFEYHLMKGGAKPLAFAEKGNFADPTIPLMEPGALLIIDAYAAHAWTPPPQGFTLVEEIAQPYSAYATTFDSPAQAGFYWHGIGILPYRFGKIAPERFQLLRWNGGN